MSPLTLHFNDDCSFSSLLLSGAATCGLQVGQSDGDYTSTKLFQTPQIPKSSRTTVEHAFLSFLSHLLTIFHLQNNQNSSSSFPSPISHTMCVVRSHGKLNLCSPNCFQRTLIPYKNERETLLYIILIIPLLLT